MSTTRVAIFYNNGKYSYGLVSNGARSDVVIDVPDEQLALWDAVSAAYGEVQNQLLLLDNEYFDNESKKLKDENPHCGSDICKLAGARTVFGHCSCNCQKCRKADGII